MGWFRKLLLFLINYGASKEYQNNFLRFEILGYNQSNYNTPHFHCSWFGELNLYGIIMRFISGQLSQINQPIISLYFKTSAVKFSVYINSNLRKRFKPRTGHSLELSLSLFWILSIRLYLCISRLYRIEPVFRWIDIRINLRLSQAYPEGHVKSFDDPKIQFVVRNKL